MCRSVYLDRGALEQDGSIGTPLGLQGVSAAVELDQGVEARRHGGGVGEHLDQEEGSEGGEGRGDPLLGRHKAGRALVKPSPGSPGQEQGLTHRCRVRVRG